MNMLQAFESAVDLFLGLRRPVTPPPEDSDRCETPPASKSTALLEAPRVKTLPAPVETDPGAVDFESAAPDEADIVEEYDDEPQVDEETPQETEQGETETEAAIEFAELTVIEAAAREALRYALNGVHVSRFYTEASDGHRLYRVYAEKPRPEGFQDLFLPLDAAKEIFKALKAQKHIKRRCAHIVARDERSVSLQVQGSPPRTYYQVEGQYPNTDALLPNFGKAVAGLPGKRLVGAYLAAGAKFVVESEKALGGDSLGLVPFHVPEHAPFYLASKLPENGTPPRAFALIMPLDK